jgi:small subunit ribosomal protein S24e
VTLSDGSEVNFERARQFMDYYCRRFGFSRPDVTYEPNGGKKRQTWDAIMAVGGRRIGLGNAPSKKEANISCYLDVTVYLEGCDPGLWKEFCAAAALGKDGPPPPNVRLQMSESLADEIRDLCSDIKQGFLWQNRPKTAVAPTPAAPGNNTLLLNYQKPSAEFIDSKSARLKRQLDEYRTDPKHETMRNTRSALPVYTKIDGLLETIEKNDVTICMAATGSGKTTQVPQLILDQWIDRGEGAKCNVICTQPRRIAAISVAERVAKEKGELLGKGSIGYQVRFESKLPLDHGSVTFCTTGIFLKRMQSALQSEASGGRSLDDVTHIVVDEVHERDVDTDLVLVVLKRLLADRKKRGLPLKIVLMSATIDPTLFRQYFPDAAGLPAPLAEIPGRSFPVEKRFLDDILREFRESVGQDAAWVFNDKAVATYLLAEVGQNAFEEAGFPQAAAMAKAFREGGNGEDLDMPYPLIALTIAHVIKRSTEGHVLVFLPGWDEIQQVQKLLQDPMGSLLGIRFSQSSKYSVHVLHSAIPIAEQQAVFEPAKEGVRRIILSTNIAETSVTIPDVVYVVDTGKVKEQRYDPDRHISSLISAWVGSSNLNQRAGRAGRHRPGEYYGLVSKKRLDKLNPYQLVEIKRVDLSNVVMHVKALNFPGMEVEDVLAQAIEPPAPERIASAMGNLRMVGALDENKSLTSLGRVLLQLPIEVQMGRLLLFGSFFRCLDHAITLAAILTNRDPFLNPPLLKKEANARKASWSPANFRSDALATLFAYNAWWEIQGRGDYQAANKFCSENFLSKPSLVQVQRLRGHLLQALYHAGVIAVSAGGVAGNMEHGRRMNLTVPPELNKNADSLPLLAALIAIGSQPNFAIRTSEKILRTAQDRVSLISSLSATWC